MALTFDPATAPTEPGRCEEDGGKRVITLDLGRLVNGWQSCSAKDGFLKGGRQHPAIGSYYSLVQPCAAVGKSIRYPALTGGAGYAGRRTSIEVGLSTAHQS